MELRGKELVNAIATLVESLRPLHISLVGGEPLMRRSELDALLPLLAPIETQLVTSAVCAIPREWARHPHLHLVVSVDGMPEEHDLRRSPATYERILRNIAGHQVIIHCTVTRQMLRREGYLREFTALWSERLEARKIWFSLFTPQRGAYPDERLTPEDREKAIRELAALPARFPKVELPRVVLDAFASPPQRPEECIFAQLTRCVSSGGRAEIRPCQLGGKPECGECGCLAAAGLAAVGRHRLASLIPLGGIYRVSKRIGDACHPLGLG